MNTNLFKSFFTVTIAALAGMTMGGLFGYGAANMAPDLFVNLFPWDNIEPIGAATVLGATGGVFCGGALGAFGIVVKLISDNKTNKANV